MRRGKNGSGPPPEELREAVDSLSDSGSLLREGDRLRLPEKFWFVSNEVLRRLPEKFWFVSNEVLRRLA